MMTELGTGGTSKYLWHLAPTPLPVTHFALARAQAEQARPYAAGVPGVNITFDSIFSFLPVKVALLPFQVRDEFANTRTVTPIRL